jgi:gamma-glutamyltranspeptidase/glutathione hydrolase/leukotriene-C4 hydrolase
VQINGEFGAAFVGPITGILYNNEMDDFSTPGFPNGYGLAPAPANFIAPKKRPLSSMSPTIVVTPEGRTLMTVGGTGGPRILTGVLQTLIEYVTALSCQFMNTE